MNIQSLRNKLEQQKGQQSQINETLVDLRKKLKIKKRSLIRHEKAREIIREVGLKTQQQLEYHIADITSLALETVFDDPYTLQVEFVHKRNKTECDLFFERDGNKIKPLEAAGVGAVDVATFALRIASWSMMNPKPNNTIILDEPFKHLSDNYQEKASIMLKELSKKLKIQFIIVSHKKALTLSADKVFEVSINNKKTRIKTN